MAQSKQSDSVAAAVRWPFQVYSIFLKNIGAFQALYTLIKMSISIDAGKKPVKPY